MLPYENFLHWSTCTYFIVYCEILCSKVSDLHPPDAFHRFCRTRTECNSLCLVPFGGFPPCVSFSVAVNSFIQLLVVLLHGVHVAQVSHAQGDRHESKRHHRFILQLKSIRSTFTKKKKKDKRCWPLKLHKPIFLQV